ncbi:anaerobic sulfatase maturase [Vibrio ziniensis]|uniref:Anaerobic sulfatase maturase n=1 Tax=Vibrio ziniensis TaxID=2711221 RepID=A0A6G7CPW6_9VIBR|nr:anaerobic sulfatase maturase [Vibrio ziniensis]QIH44086.1 anaerobic sulfatase maturase [Vibrio ziniensis]
MYITTVKPSACNPFHVLVKPIGPLCNLDCDYCFYLDKSELFPNKNRFDMSDEALEAHIKAYIEGQPSGTNEVTFGWQGGEPTLRGIEFYKKAIAFQHHYKRHGMTVVNTFQTNGVLLDDDWALFLKQHHFLVGISIDGDEQLHNHFRKYRNGKGSYLQAVRGLRLLQKYGVEYNVLTAVQANNGSHGRRVYQHLVSLGAEFIQFIPVVEAVVDVGISDRSVGSEQFGHFMIDVFNAWREKDIGKIFVSHFDNALGMSLGMPSSICVHSPKCGYNLVIEHNGDVYSCDHFVYPEFKLGNIERNNYPDLIETPIQQSFACGKLVASDLHCVNCSQRRLCHGACPAHRITLSGRISFKEKQYLCEGYFIFFTFVQPYLNAMKKCLMKKLPITYYLNMI